MDSDDSQVCADGNASDNWDAPPAGGWSFYDNGLRVCASVPQCECVCVDDHDHAAYCSVLETNCIPLGGYAVYTPFVFTSRWHAYFAY